MTSLIIDALHAGGTGTARATEASGRRSALVVGGGGALGSAVLERLLGGGRFAPVRVLVSRSFSTAVQGLEPVVVAALAGDDLGAAPLADVAIVVFDRERHANGRELGFARPQPHELPELAAWLHRRRVRHLLVVLPHSPSGLPDALKAGLANLDEHAVAMLGFEHLLIVRSAQTPVDRHATRWLQRLADGALAQLRFLVPASNQPVRAGKVAQFVAELAAQLPQSTPAIRIVPPELVWQAAQLRDPGALAAAWLDGRELPPLDLPKRRL